MTMRTLKLTIAYDGTRYAGWQIQRVRSAGCGARSTRFKPTIQGTLERVLHRILRERVQVIGSGRTDAGVHALAQVAHAKTTSALPCERLQRALNHLLPRDIAILRLEDAPEDFHARFSAATKRYRYRIFTGPVVTPFLRPYVHHVRAPLRLGLMRRAFACVRGRHAFDGFARRRSLRLRPSTTDRTITEAILRRRGEEIHLEIEGDGFLHTMVRSLAGTLVDIGRGHLPPGTIARMLAHGERHLAGTTAPSRGLTLVEVTYRKPACRAFRRRTGWRAAGRRPDDG